MNTRKLGRLSLRVEGPRWVAYFAQDNSRDDAVEIGSILMSIVGRSKQCKENFRELMQLAMVDVIFAATGHEAEWGEPTVAPECERSGNA
ncbi:hypothetical protein DRQ53_07965 [bacterium]|nr:MAG: hypothetical protein DRQ53_07965 [bacterium]